MGLRKYVRQAKPTQENKVDYVSNVDNLIQLDIHDYPS